MRDEPTHDEWRGRLPFYVAATLPGDERAAFEHHMSSCEMCRAEIRDWQLLAGTVRREAAMRSGPLPPLSPVVRASLYRHPTAGEALRAAAHLIGAQWAVLRGLLPVALLVLLLGILGTIGLRDDTGATLPLLAVVPIVAAVSVAFLHHSEADPAWEVVAATPTSPGALVFARLALVLGLIVTVMLAGSFAVSALTGETLASLIAMWLGPMLLLSALATVLALRWTAVVGAGVSLALWVTIISMLVRELAGDPRLPLSLHPLLDPGWLLFGSQLVGAGFLWYVGWRLANSRLTPSRGLS